MLSNVKEIYQYDYKKKYFRNYRILIKKLRKNHYAN